MRFNHRFTSTAGAAVIALALALAAGCDEQGTTQNQQQNNKPAEQTKPAVATQPLIKVAQIADWCPEHGVPESVCTRCNASLVAGFKAKGDWDEEHGLPKSQCFECDPSLKEKFAAAYKEKYGKEPPPMTEGEHHHDHEGGKEGTEETEEKAS